MTHSEDQRPRKQGKKIRVPMRRNRAKRARISDWTRKAREAEGHEFDTISRESVVAKGEVSRRRTIVVDDDRSLPGGELRLGTVLGVHGLHVQVDDGGRVITCSVPRLLRTLHIQERTPVTVGDRVQFRHRERVGGAPEGVIEIVQPRKGLLQRRVGTRLQTVVANVDQAVVVSSADEPPPKPNLIDRYIVSALSGEIAPVICMNKVDLDQGGRAQAILERYRGLAYSVLSTSAVTGEGIDCLRTLLKDKASVVAGQSGVGKSSLLNAVQPELGLRVGEVTRDTKKGRHTTTLASLLRLDVGGYVVDTPGIRSFELATVDPYVLEGYFAEFVPLVAGCKFPDCTHTHETSCAVKAAVEHGDIHSERYESYVRLFDEGTAGGRYSTR